MLYSRFPCLRDGKHPKPFLVLTLFNFDSAGRSLSTICAVCIKTRLLHLRWVSPVSLPGTVSLRKAICSSLFSRGQEKPSWIILPPAPLVRCADRCFTHI